MRSLLFFSALFVLSFASGAATAGSLTYVDGKGSWVSTSCTPPQSPDAQAVDSETAADDLNAQLAQHNSYVLASESYLNCLSQEAQRDAESAAHMVVRSAESDIKAVQAQIAETAARLNKKRAESAAGASGAAK